MNEGEVLSSADSSMRFIANGLVIGAMLWCGLSGWKSGLLKATFFGFGMIAAFVVSLAIAEGVAEGLIQFDVAESHAAGLAYIGLLTGLLFGLHAGIKAYASESLWYCETFAARAVAGVTGALTGLVLSGSVLVGWSTIPLPDTFAVPRNVIFDAGEFSLQLFAKCMARDRGSREKMLGGLEYHAEPWPRCSEPFVDKNGNCRRDDDERYIDFDRDGVFSVRLPTRRDEQRSTWEFGLLDYYRLASWKTPTTLHAPQMTSPNEVELENIPASGEVIYTATAEDPDPCDQSHLRFTLTASNHDSASLIQVDEVTGVVTILPAQDAEPTDLPDFSVTATDAAGLQSQSLLVRVRIKGQNAKIAESNDSPPE